MSLKDKAVDVPTFLANIREIYTSDFRWQSSEKYVKLSDAEEEIQTLVELLKRAVPFLESYERSYRFVGMSEEDIKVVTDHNKTITQTLKKYEPRG